MALTVQDDFGLVVGANSYIDVAYFKAYHDDRGNLYSSYTDPQISLALVKATDYLDTRFIFTGKKLQGRDQTTEWPRLRAKDRDRKTVSGIPVEVKEATAEYALRAFVGALNPDPIRDTTGQLVKRKSEVVGPLESETEYVGGSVWTFPKYPAADQKLYKAGLALTGGDLRRG
jgi:hypothetical protein